MNARGTEAMQAAILAAKAQGRQEGAELVAAVIMGWYGRSVPEALQKRLARIHGELGTAQRSTLAAFTEQFGRELVDEAGKAPRR